MRYFTVKEGALVTRLGTNTYLGATVGVEQTGPRKGQTQITWTPGEVVGLSDEELQQYGREYGALLAEGSLVESDEKAYTAFAEGQAKEAGAQAEKSALEAKLDAAREAQRSAAAEAEQAKAKAEQAKADAERLTKELQEVAAAEKRAQAEAAKQPTIDVAAPAAQPDTKPAAARSKE